MNYVFLNGYVQNKSTYLKNIDGQSEFRFFVSSRSKVFGETYAIPVKVLGQMADVLYSKLNEKYYVEILGELIRKDINKAYVLGLDITCTPPNSKTAFYVKSSEFLELFSPKQVLTRALNKKDAEPKKFEQTPDDEE